MTKRIKFGKLGLVASGLLAGFAASLLVFQLFDNGEPTFNFPNFPIEASATDSNSTFAMATGQIDQDIEAVYFLDALTGDLNGVVLSQQSGKFMVYYHRNILADLGVDPTKNPKFLMVTGAVNLRRGAGGSQPGPVVVYIAEITTGKVAAYAIPWSAGMKNLNRPTRLEFIPLGRTICRRQTPGTGM